MEVSRSSCASVSSRGSINNISDVLGNYRTSVQSTASGRGSVPGRSNLSTSSSNTSQCLYTYFCGTCGAKAITLRGQISDMPTRSTDKLKILEDKRDINVLYLKERKKAAGDRQLQLECQCGLALAYHRPDLEEMYFNSSYLTLVQRKGGQAAMI